MRFFPILAAALSFASFAFAQEDFDFDEEQIVVESEDVEPQLLAAGAWPETNPFGHVVNGEKNTIGVLVENRLNRNITLLNVAGAFYQPESDILVKNLSAMAYGIEMVEGLKLQLPYSFFSEFKPGDLRLSIWVDHLDQVYSRALYRYFVRNQLMFVKQGEQLRVIAFDSIVQIVEPEGSWFDFKLYSTYLVVSAMVAGLGYVAYLSFVPQPKKKSRKPAISGPTGTVTASGAGYQEEWIPSHHLKSRKKGGAVSSGDELSGAETSGTEGNRRKGRK
ncbi:hypothetical protein GYMLUDRAFT_502229 [Collybiopsis luxurians FD-317 M1]|uniref:Translocon-associated protein subunit alpha n=1 Tax=Collybiopsis luxurians FD-317 M1 TaxID=944289 RepID=A0A0D0C344_9AGAR|nr:hypothetical protein GYMLUDRAFT_502229 [Collybiopsis luxurians FD-317 M1]